VVVKFSVDVINLSIIQHFRINHFNQSQIGNKFQFDTSNIPPVLNYLKLVTSKFIDSKKVIIH